MAEMTSVVNRHATHVHGDLAGLSRGKDDLVFSTGVVQSNWHGIQPPLQSASLQS